MPAMGNSTVYNSPFSVISKAKLVQGNVRSLYIQQYLIERIIPWQSRYTKAVAHFSTVGKQTLLHIFLDT